MKRTYSRAAGPGGILRLLLAGSVAGCLFLTACDRTEERSARLTLGQSEVPIPAAGGGGQIAYTLENPSAGSVFRLECPAPWVGSLEAVEAEHVIRFSAEANPGPEPRETSVTVSYGRAEPRSFTIRQAAPETPDEQSFTVTFPEIGTDYVLARTVPALPDETYAVLAIARKPCDENFPTDDLLFDYILDDYRRGAALADQSLADYLNGGILLRGEKELRLKGLPAETEHYLLVFGLTETGKRTTPVLREPFTTEAPEEQEVTFSLDYEIDGPAVTMSVTPSADDVPYYFNVISLAELERSGKTLEETAQENIDIEITLGQVFGQSKEEVLRKLCSRGPASYRYKDLNARTDYAGYAVAVDSRTGRLNSELTRKDFRTGSVPGSDNILTLTLGEPTVNSVPISVTATNNDPYAVYVDRSEHWEGTVGEELIDGLSSLDHSGRTHRGNWSGTETRLSAGTEYTVFVFGIRSGQITTDIVRQDFRTADAGNPADLQFTFTVSGITRDKASVTVSGEPSTASYYWNIRLADATADEIKAEMEADIQRYLDNGWVSSRAEYMQLITVTGTDSFDFEGLVSGTAYRPYAVGIYDASGEYATDIIFGETFRTEEAARSEVQIEITYEKYFNGDEVSATYPKYDGAEGKAVLPVEAVLTGEAADYYYHVFSDDLTDPEAYPDNLLIQNLVTYGIQSQPKKTFYCSWDADLTLLAVAVDKDGAFGPVFRKKVRFTPDGAAPIEDFNPSPAAPDYSAVSILSTRPVPPTKTDSIRPDTE